MTGKQRITEIAVACVLLAFVVLLLVAITQELSRNQEPARGKRHVPADSTDLRKQLQSVQFEPTARGNDE